MASDSTGPQSGYANQGCARPGDATPGDTTPGDTTPGDTTPGDTTPSYATPSYAFLDDASRSGATPLELMRCPPPAGRADAARNRAAILAAAAELIAEHGVAAVSMDQVAAAARVGKGTLFRRFGDKAGLAAALLDEREAALQGAILHGPPPLGPGAPAADRLAAFTSAYLDYLLRHLDLVRMSETAAPGARYRIGAYQFWHRHVAILLADAVQTPHVPDESHSMPDASDHDYAAHALLAPLAAEHVSAILPSLGEQRIRNGAIRQARAAAITARHNTTS